MKTPSNQSASFSNWALVALAGVVFWAPPSLAVETQCLYPRLKVINQNTFSPQRAPNGETISVSPAGQFDKGRCVAFASAMALRTLLHELSELKTAPAAGDIDARKLIFNHQSITASVKAADNDHDWVDAALVRFFERKMIFPTFMSDEEKKALAAIDGETRGVILELGGPVVCTEERKAALREQIQRKYRDEFGSRIVVNGQIQTPRVTSGTSPVMMAIEDAIVQSACAPQGGNLPPAGTRVNYYFADSDTGVRTVNGQKTFGGGLFAGSGRLFAGTGAAPADCAPGQTTGEKCGEAWSVIEAQFERKPDPSVPILTIGGKLFLDQTLPWKALTTATRTSYKGMKVTPWVDEIRKGLQNGGIFIMGIRPLTLVSQFNAECAQQVFVDPNTGDTVQDGSHAVVIYGYSEDAGTKAVTRLKVADPNGARYELIPGSSTFAFAGLPICFPDFPIFKMANGQVNPTFGASATAFIFHSQRYLRGPAASKADFQCSTREITSSCIKSKASPGKIFLWSKNSLKERGTFDVVCSPTLSAKGFTDPKAFAEVGRSTDSPSPPHEDRYKADGWFFHGEFTTSDSDSGKRKAPNSAMCSSTFTTEQGQELPPGPEIRCVTQ